MKASIYIHVPFCASLCDYCDFYSIETRKNDARLDIYIDKILHDVQNKIQIHTITSCPSVYIGGGTPSLLGPKRLEKLLRALLDCRISSDAEISVEANPESIDLETIEVCAAAGLTRISLGVQSLDENARRLIGRRGSVRAAREAASLIGNRFAGSFSADLMAGLPGQSRETLCRDIEYLLDCGAKHISLYELTIEKETALGQRVAAGLIEIPDNEAAAEIWEAGAKCLYSHGLKRYEISNFAYPGEESVHNLRYWNMENWIAGGPAAVSQLLRPFSPRGVRLSEPRDVDLWFSGAKEEKETIDSLKLLKEIIIMGFRLRAGPPVEKIYHYFKWPIQNFIGQSLDTWSRRGLIESNTVALNDRGLDMLNRFLVDCLSEIDMTYPKYEESRR